MIQTMLPAEVRPDWGISALPLPEFFCQELQYGCDSIKYIAVPLHQRGQFPRGVELA